MEKGFEVYVPTEEEIEQECAKIREGWSEEEHERRWRQARTVSNKLVHQEVEPMCMKEQRLLVGMAPDYDVLVRCVQELCHHNCVQKLVQTGTWKFEILQNKSTQWWNAFILSDFEVWKKILAMPQLIELRGRLEELVEKQRNATT